MNDAAESVLRVVGGIVCWTVGFVCMIVVLGVGWQSASANRARPPHPLNRVPDPDLEKETERKE